VTFGGANASDRDSWSGPGWQELPGAATNVGFPRHFKKGKTGKPWEHGAVELQPLNSASSGIRLTPENIDGVVMNAKFAALVGFLFILTSLRQTFASLSETAILHQVYT
jgi:hypothetical protein